MDYSSPKDSPVPQISILIPVFNREKFIRPCIESALNQSFQNFEIIIVDNASTDKTWKICREISLTDKRIRLYKNSKNIGPVKNWISCAKYAKAEFSKVLFSDDLLEWNCLDRMLKMIGDDVGFVYSSARIGTSKTNSKVCYKLKNTTKNYLNLDEFIKFVMYGDAPCSPGAALFRTKDILKNIHLTFPTSTIRDYELHGAGPDLMLFLLTLENYSRASIISEPLVYFRAHAGSFSVGNLRAEVRDSYRSVIAFYLKRKYPRYIWANYISREWIKGLYRFNFKNPIKFMNEYEGNESYAQLIFFLIGSIGAVFNILHRKIRPRTY